VELLPSGNVKEGTQVTATCFSINPLELNASKFFFYMDSEPIQNISTSTRLDIFLMSQGNHNFTCYTNGTANYSKQTITRFVNVSIAPPPPPSNASGALIIKNFKLPAIEAGKSVEVSFDLTDDTTKNIFNLSVILSGIPSEWFTVEKPSYIYVDETKAIKIYINVPADTESKSYPVKINVSGHASNGTVMSVEKSSVLVVNGTALNRPPSYFSGYTETSGSETSFSLEWHDDNGLSGYIFSSNASGTWENETWIPMTGTDGLFNVNKSLSSQAGSAVAWKIYANDSNGDWSASNEFMVATNQVAPTDSTLIMIPIAIFIAAVAIIILLVKKKHKAPKEPEYVYNMDDLDEKG